MKYKNIPVRPRNSRGLYRLAEADKDRLKSYAVNGVISIDDYMRVMQEILNEKVASGKI